MQIFSVGKNYKNITRLIKIVSIVGRYGFSAFLSRLRSGLGAVPARIFHIRQEQSTRTLSEPERVRLAVEELGPAFIKMGQLLSLRPDIIPSEYATALEKLQDRNPHVPFEQIKRVVENEIGLPLSEVFDDFEHTPVASGSIAQVHRACLKDNGECVAVKVLKPKTRETIEKDLAIMRLFTRLALHYIPELRQYHPEEMLHEFSEILLGELNFLHEAHVMERFSRFFSGKEYIHIPTVYQEFTTTRLLVMEFIDGIKISNVKELEEAGMDKKAIVENGGHASLSEVFEFGFFHADPHPGNLFVLPGNVIAPVDFGITGYIDREGVLLIGNVLSALIEQDVDRVIRYLRRYNFLPDETDIRRLKIDLYEIMDVARDRSISKLDVPSSLHGLFDLTRKYRIRLPGEYLLILRTFLEVDGLGRKLYPEFNITAFSKPYIKKWFYAQHSPGRYVKDILSVLDDLNFFIRSLPTELGQVLRRFTVGRLRLPIVHENLDRAVSEIDRVGNRLSFAIIIAALLLSSSILVQAGIGPFIKGYPVPGLAGFFTAAVMGVWLLVGIIRSGRLH
jgi:ubiquinone biosynthesis protein